MTIPAGLRLRLLWLTSVTLAAGLLIAVPAVPAVKLGVLGLLSLGTGAVLVLRHREPTENRDLAADVPEILDAPQDLQEVSSVESAVPAPDSGEEGTHGPGLGDMVDSLRSRFGELRDALSSLKSPETGAGQASEAADAHRLELVTIKASADFITENILRAFEISDNLANTAKTAFELSESVQKGVTIVTDALGLALTQTGILFDQSKQISKIIEIMSEISEKIHILSINASIVSARAGTAGKGFEVVAKEIRSLARETEKSLEEIEQVVVDVQSTINTVVEKVDTASRQTNNEQQNLISVAGSLQGVILGVEIIRAVTSMAKEKAEEQQSSMQTWISEDTDDTAGPEEHLESLQEVDPEDILDEFDQGLTALEATIKERS